MSALAHRRFLKMHGAGNAIVVLDLRGTPLRVSAAEARAIAADPGSSFDQLMVLHDPVTTETDAFMRIYNTDGSESGACGNGTRCVAFAMLDDPAMARPAEGGRLLLETSAGRVGVRRIPSGPSRSIWAARISPGTRSPGRALPRYPSNRIADRPIDAPVLHSPGVVNMGNPHAVFFVDADPDTYDLGRIGPLLENHRSFPNAPTSRWPRCSAAKRSSSGFGSVAPV